MQRDEFDAKVSDLEVRLERVRSLYEQYFLGFEKLEPTVARKDLDRRFFELRKVRLRNTALRFKFQTLTQRYSTLQQYWLRICRQIENGTYARHVRRAARLMTSTKAPHARTASNPATDPPAPTHHLDGDLDHGLGSDRIGALHEEFARARKQLNQGDVSAASVEKRIRAAEAQLRAQHPGKSVDFRVQVKDGKAVIKPFLK